VTVALLERLPSRPRRRISERAAAVRASVRAGKIARQLDAIGDAYLEGMLELYLRPLHEATLERLRAALAERMRRNAPGDDVIGELRRQFVEAIDPAPLEALAADIAAGVDVFATGRLSETLGFSIDELAKDARQMVDAFVAENVQRIKAEAETFLFEVQQEVADSFAEGERWEDLADRIAERTGVSESRAELIARDQVGKLNGAINAERQQDLGIERFVWRTSNDSRVRPEHDELDGQVFAWSEPPEEGIPGEPINCRCYADPVLPGDLQEGA
jgi:SPP1 gp7 family putative phage head morphogenesis protein